MPRYCVNKHSQANGDHEVHDLTANCEYLPRPENQEYLGDFTDCHGAVREARARHPDWKVNGCYYCAKDCHTS